MIPPKLKAGDHVHVIAPSHSFAPAFTDEMKAQAPQGISKNFPLGVPQGEATDRVKITLPTEKDRRQAE